MASFQAIGNQSAGAASVAVAWPAHAIDDLGIMVIETGGEGTTLAVPSGWTAVTGSPVTAVATTAGSKLQVWYKFATSAAEANVNTGDSGDHQVARIVTFRGVNKTTPFDVTPVTGTKTTASTTVTWDSITTATDNALVVLLATRPDDSTSVTNFSNPVNANLTTLTERGEAGTNAGHGGGFVVVTGTKATAGATGTTTCSSVASTTNAEMVIALRPAPAAQTLTPSLFTNDQTFHNPTVTSTRELTPSLFTNDQTFFSPDVTTGGGTQALTASLYTNDQTFYGPTATATYSLTPGKYDNAQTFYAASVTQTGGPQTLLPDLYTNAQSFFAPTVAASNTLTPALYTNEQTFFAPTVTATRTLTPGLFTNAQTFFAPTAAATYSLTPAKYDNEQTFYAATVTSGTTLAPNRYDNTQTFYGPTVGRGAVDLAPSLYTNTQTFFAPTVTPGAIDLQPALVTNDQEFYAPVVGQSGGLQTLLPDLVENTQTFYAATVTPGAVALAPQGYVDDGYVDGGYVGPNTFSTQVFYSPKITLDVRPPLVTNTSQFFAATVENSLYTITRAQALRLLQIHLLHGLAASPLVVSASSRSAGAVEQTVTQSGTTVTIATTSAPSVFSGDAGALIDELAALHGLTADLIVTPTSRTAGAISQTLAQAGTTTTVTRV